MRSFIRPTFVIAGVALASLAPALFLGSAPAQLPAPVEAPGETPLLRLRAAGAQLYECKADAEGKLAWAFREPVATLMLDGNTVGRHYRGPTFEHMTAARS